MKQQKTAYVCSQSQHLYDIIDEDFSEHFVKRTCSVCTYWKLFPRTKEETKKYKENKTKAKYMAMDTMREEYKKKKEKDKEK